MMEEDFKIIIYNLLSYFGGKFMAIWEYFKRFANANIANAWINHILICFRKVNL